MTTERPFTIRLVVCCVFAFGASVASLATIYATPVEGVGSLACGSGIFSCSETLQSSYAKIFGVPVGVPATGYFAAVAASLAATGLTGRCGLRTVVTWMLVPGLAASVFFVAVMTVLLKSFCLYCLMTHGCNALLIASFAPLARWRATGPQIRAALWPIGIAAGIGVLTTTGAFAADAYRQEQSRRFIEEQNVW